MESKRFPASKSKWWLEDFWMMMMMMMIVVVVVMIIMTRFQTCDYTRILGDVPFNFCCTFAFFCDDDFWELQILVGSEG